LRLGRRDQYFQSIRRVFVRLIMSASRGEEIRRDLKGAAAAGRSRRICFIPKNDSIRQIPPGCGGFSQFPPVLIRLKDRFGPEARGSAQHDGRQVGKRARCGSKTAILDRALAGRDKSFRSKASQTSSTSFQTSLSALKSGRQNIASEIKGRRVRLFGDPSSAREDKRSKENRCP
jgi:hypothetical protein